MELRKIFNEDEVNYDRYRPGYPDALYNDIFRCAALHEGSSVLEIGTGTGQATLPFLQKSCNVTGIELGDNELFQFVETQNMDLDDYEDIIKNGWDQWYYRYMCRIQNPPFTDPGQLFARFGQLGMNGASNIAFNRSLGVEPSVTTVVIPAF
ncbi:MAG: hypothetical protein MJ118_05450, partial [Clostridia bacterium]|nr:hypothetical protein [Clostridia bacterium]